MDEKEKELINSSTNNSTSPSVAPIEPVLLADVEMPKPVEQQTVTMSSSVTPSNESVTTPSSSVETVTPTPMSETTFVEQARVEPTGLTENMTLEPTETLSENEKKTQKPQKKRGKKILSLIVNLLLWVILIGWVALVVMDYMHIQNEEQPQFCWFNQKTIEYKDGTVKECTGLGYKVINYDRSSFKAVEFGPFWIKDRTAQNK